MRGVSQTNGITGTPMISLGTLPNVSRGSFKVSDIGNESFIHLFLTIPLISSQSRYIYTDSLYFFLPLTCGGSYPTTPHHIWHIGIVWCSISVLL